MNPIFKLLRELGEAFPPALLLLLPFLLLVAGYDEWQARRNGELWALPVWEAMVSGRHPYVMTLIKRRRILEALSHIEQEMTEREETMRGLVWDEATAQLRGVEVELT